MSNINKFDLEQLERALAWRAENPQARSVKAEWDAEKWHTPNRDIFTINIFDFSVPDGCRVEPNQPIPDLKQLKRDYLRAQLAEIEEGEHDNAD